VASLTLIRNFYPLYFQKHPVCWCRLFFRWNNERSVILFAINHFMRRFLVNKVNQWRMQNLMWNRNQLDPKVKLIGAAQGNIPVEITSAQQFTAFWLAGTSICQQGLSPTFSTDFISQGVHLFVCYDIKSFSEQLSHWLQTGWDIRQLLR